MATLEEFPPILLSANIQVFTGHKNLTFDNLRTGVLLWHNKIEYFLSWFHCIKDRQNILADNLLSLRCLPTPSQIVEGKAAEPTVVSDNQDDEALVLLKSSES